MTNVGSHNQNLGRDPNQGMGAALLGFGGIAVLIFLATSAVAVFQASFAAGAVVVLVIAVSAALAIAVYRNQKRVTASLTLLGLAALWAAVAGTVVFKHHLLAFTPAAWIFNVLFVAGLLSGAWSSINVWLKTIAALLALSSVTAILLLPRPRGGEGPFDTAEEWRINVEVKEREGGPLQSASVFCAAVMKWKYELSFAPTLARETDRDGRIPTWEFKEDPRLKIVICNAWKTPNDGNAGYPPASQLVVSIASGGEYKLDFELVENPHPDLAFLTFDLSGDYDNGPYALQFELWSGNPVGYFGQHESSAQPFQTKSWQELRRGGFAIPSEVATQDMQLRYHYQGTDREGYILNYNETRTIQVGAIEPGTRKRLDLRIPNKF